MATETERKYLLSTLPQDLPPGERIDQGYLAREPDGTEVRVRRRSGRCRLTVKSGVGRTRREAEVEIDDASFATLWPLTEGRRVEKVRHVVAHDGGLEIEVDVYSGDLAGLLVAEVEFPTEEDAERFDAPAWFGLEVTEDARYKNARLATDGRPHD